MFDTVNHQIILAKLYHYGIRGTTNDWFSSYISNRYQTVTINGITFSRRPITCGVPPGSILGPLLYPLYINDMHISVQSLIMYHFADYTNLLYFNKSIKRLRIILNKDVALLYGWLCVNRISLNTRKTEFIVFMLPRKTSGLHVTLKSHQTKLIESSKMKYLLRTILDNKLNWKSHINELSKKPQSLQ